MRVSFLVPAACLSVGLLSTGCGNSGTSGGQAPCDSPSAQQAQGAQSAAKIQMSTQGDELIEAGTELSAVIRDACQEKGPISSLIPELFEGTTQTGVRSYLFKLPQSMTTSEIAAWADTDSCVTLVEDARFNSLIDENVDNPDVAETSNTAPGEHVNTLTLPADPNVGVQAHLTAIRASQAYDTFYNAQSGIQTPVVIAVIDSGVKLDHEDLKDNLWVNKGEIPNNGIDDDKNGYTDDVYGYNHASRIANPSPQVSTANKAWQWAHGTRVAGLAAAVGGNGKGGTGVMGNAKIMSLNAMGTSSGFSQATLANAIRYAADNGANVINLSLGGSPAGTDYKNALNYAVARGVVVVAAAGNESSLIGASYSAAGLGPSTPGIISIGNVRASDLNKATGSNYSTVYVELGAPGSFDAAKGLYSPSPTAVNAYAYFMGTSAATPVAAGGAALAMGLIKSRGYTYTAGEIEQLLIETAQKVPGLKSYFKDGNLMDLEALAARINALYPVKVATPPSTPTTTPPTTPVIPPVVGQPTAPEQPPIAGPPSAPTPAPGNGTDGDGGSNAGTVGDDTGTTAPPSQNADGGTTQPPVNKGSDSNGAQPISPALGTCLAANAGA